MGRTQSGWIGFLIIELLAACCAFSLVGHYGNESGDRSAPSCATQRTKARAALVKLAQDRAQFEASWAAYAAQLQELLHKQFEQRTSTLEDFAKAEVSWRTALQESSEALKKLGETGEPSSAQVDSDMELELPGKDDPPSLPNLEAIRAGQRQLMAALQEVQASAQQHAKRDGSRTPRRGKRGEGGQEQQSSSSPDPWKDVAEVAPPSQAVTAAATASQEVAALKSSGLQPFGKPRT